MDARMKIIIAVFLLAIVFYFLQFMLEFIKKKEHFTSSYFDDVEESSSERSRLREHFEDAKAAPKEAPADNKPYELRIFILDEIEKLNIADKTIKGNVMEALFSETAMKELEGMTKDQRVAKVKSVYDGAKGAAPAAPAKAPAAQVAPKQSYTDAPSKPDDSGKFIEEKIKAYFSNEVKIDSEPNEQSEQSEQSEPSKESFDDSVLQARVQKAAEKLDVVIHNLKEMKGFLSTKEGYNQPAQTNTRLPELPKVPKDPFLVEGFENIRGYAYY